MEKNIALGKIAKLSLDIGGGKASLGVSASDSELDGAVKFSSESKAEMSTDQFVDMLKAVVEAKSPPGVVVLEEIIFMELKKGLASL